MSALYASNAPGSLVVGVDAMAELYVQTPGSSKKRYTGESYSCKICHQLVAGQSPNEHYRLNHQRTARIRFADQKRVVELKRSPTTDMFECPRCPALFRSPRQIQEHVGSWDGKCARASAATSPVKSSKRSAQPKNPAATPIKRRRGPEPSQLVQQSKTVARPLKTPTRTRTGIPQISRTFRAMIRQCYNQRTMSNKEIAEFCNCDVRDVYFAVNNEADDDLDDDQAYLDGQLGDIINIDDFPEVEAVEAFRMDEKMEMDVELAPDDGPAEQVPADQPASRSEAYPTPESDVLPEPVPEDDALASEDEIERDYIRVIESPEPEAKPTRRTKTNIKSTRRKPRTRDKLVEVPPKAPQAQQISRKAPSQDPVLQFVASLEGVTPQAVSDMSSVLKTYGVATAKDIDLLSDMEEYWDDVERYFCKQGLTQYHWTLICTGLRARAEALRR